MLLIDHAYASREASSLNFGLNIPLHLYFQYVRSEGFGEDAMGPDKDSLCTFNCIYFLTHQFKHVFWVLKGTISLRQFF